MIRIEGLSKKYGSHQVLRDIHLAFKDGWVYGIVGENGAGKTTLFKCIAGLEKYDGAISSSYERLKDHLGYLPTEPYFFARITGREYIRLLCQARGTNPGDMDGRNVFDLPLDQYASTYSTGMKKKLAFLAILMQENMAYILDEPFNGVDIQSNMLITGIIHKLKALGKTVIISSHIFSTLSDTCDEIHLIREGRFIRKVSHADYKDLEETMKAVTIGDRIEKLNLR
jgi:ABC-2 type transport system ATP-binding protein